MHPISGGEIFFHSDRVAAWTPGRCGTPNIRIKSFGLCANTFDVPANRRTGTTIPNHLDTAVSPQLEPPRCHSYGHKSGFSNAAEIFRRFNMLSVFNGQVLAYPGNAVPFVSSRSIMLRGLVIAGNDG